MNYNEARDYIKNIETAGIDLGLDRMRDLMKLLNNIEKEFKIIHIAGTNGKGSVLSYISSALAYAGLKVGRFSSPAVFNPREIISFESLDKEKNETNITYISKENYSKYVFEISKILNNQKDLKPRAFEFETAMAFLAFKEENCQVVLLETGLGGKLDATNFIENSLCQVISPVSFDHKAFLGNTIAEIAYEKAGIIKKNSLVITYQKIPAANMVIEEVCRKKNSTLKKVYKDDISFLKYNKNRDDFTLEFSYKNEILETKMCGLYQIENAALAYEALYNLKDILNISQENIYKGIKEAFWKGRFQIIETNPYIIIDGAHNLDGVLSLKQSLDSIFPQKKYYGIFGCFKDKDYCSMIENSPELEEVVCINAPGKRGIKKEIIQKIWQEKKRVKTNIKDGINEALLYLKNKVKKEDVIVIFGTLSFLKDLEFNNENWK